MTIEGKVSESFSQTLDEWLVGASRGKLQRLDYICRLLGFAQPVPGNVHYQLLHRTASAVIEARRFKTDAAAMIVHSFSVTRMWFDAFERFVRLFGCEAATGKLIHATTASSTPVYLGWAIGGEEFLAA